jgi:hypothetical protein
MAVDLSATLESVYYIESCGAPGGHCFLELYDG